MGSLKGHQATSMRGCNKALGILLATFLGHPVYLILLNMYFHQYWKSIFKRSIIIFPAHQELFADKQGPGPNGQDCRLWWFSFNQSFFYICYEPCHQDIRWQLKYIKLLFETLICLGMARDIYRADYYR